MIMFWIIAGVMTLAVAVLLAVPLFDTRKLKSDDAFALEVYRDQLHEINRDEARGLLTAEEARAAQIEIERRILALDEAPRYKPAQPPGHRMTMAMAVVLPLVGFLFYLMIGSPQLPGQPLAGRGAELALHSTPEIRRLEEQLSRSPSDAQAWIDLGRAYGQAERARDAADAFARALALGRNEPDLQRDYGRALVVAEDGMVSDRASEAFRQVLATDPTDPTARFFLALAKAQNDDVETALTEWLALEADLPPDSPIRPTLGSNIDRAARELGVDPATLPGRTKTAAGSSANSPNAGPSAEDMAAAENMTPEERSAFIQGMVDRLAERLKSEPDDLEGWIRLARAYEVMEQSELAKAAWAKAAELAPARIDVQLDYASALIVGRPDLDRDLPTDFVSTVKRIRTLDASNPLGLFYGGMVERAEGRPEAARALWQQVLALLPEGSPQRADLQKQIDALEKPTE